MKVAQPKIRWYSSASPILLGLMMTHVDAQLDWRNCRCMIGENIGVYLAIYSIQSHLESTRLQTCSYLLLRIFSVKRGSPVINSWTPQLGKKGEALFPRSPRLSWSEAEDKVHQNKFGISIASQRCYAEHHGYDFEVIDPKVARCGVISFFLAKKWGPRLWWWYFIAFPGRFSKRPWKNWESIGGPGSPFIWMGHGTPMGLPAGFFVSLGQWWSPKARRPPPSWGLSSL